MEILVRMNLKMFIVVKKQLPTNLIEIFHKKTNF